MPSPANAQPKLPTRAEVARALKLKPTPVERADGYDSGASLLESVTEVGDELVVVTVRGGKHRLPLA